MDASKTIRSLQKGQRSRSWVRRNSFFDNYLIRFLLGPDVYFLPSFRINESHLGRAKQKIQETFAVVVPLENIQVVEECLGTLTRWNTTALPHNNRRDSSWKDYQTVAIREYFERLNRLDLELYYYAYNLSLHCTSRLHQFVGQMCASAHREGSV